jgi:DNA-binding MarR family transcriptional regulator
MNKTIELVNQWGAFEEQFPTGDLDDFCRHYLASRKKEMDHPIRGGGGTAPLTTDSRLMRLIGRIAKLHSIFATAALEGSALNSIEEFGLLNTIRQLREPKKTEAIYACLYELSTGTDMLARLRKKELFVEYHDKEDKRSKRLKLTKKGEAELDRCHERVKQLASIMMGDLQEDDKKLCIQLLKVVEDKFVGLWQDHKGKSPGEILAEISKH